LDGALADAVALGLGRQDSQRLLLHALHKPATDRAWLIAHDRDTIEAAAQGRFDEFTRRLASGEPLAYILGQQEFFGLLLKVDPRVLIPRPDTETLVDWALKLGPAYPDEGSVGFKVLDLGTGSGAIALALKAGRPAWDVSAVEASADALALARENAQALGLAVTMEPGHWLDQINGSFDLIVSNPPYVREGDEHLAALRHEPLQALTAGADGLADFRQIIEHAPGHLRVGGWLLLEHGYDQASDLRQLLLNKGFEAVSCRSDLAGIPRCSGGRWPGAGNPPESA
jgi:release factor glutamine methyltransferase